MARVLGAVVGSLLALVFIQPKSVAGFVRRMISSLMVGFIGGPVLFEYCIYMNWMIRDWDALVAATSAAAFFSWWGLGSFLRLLAQYGRDIPSDPSEKRPEHRRE